MRSNSKGTRRELIDKMVRLSGMILMRKEDGGVGRSSGGGWGSDNDGAVGRVTSDVD